MDLIEGDSSCYAMPVDAAVLSLLRTLSLVRQRRPVMHAHALDDAFAYRRAPRA